jgi:FtsP/CotA-like multicopper oxidase with cupredoxin domain
LQFFVTALDKQKQRAQESRQEIRRLGEARMLVFNRNSLIVALAAASAAIGALPAMAQAEREVANPRLLADEGEAASTSELEAVQGPGSTAHERVLDLDVVYTDSQLFNPATGLYDKVHLRSYNRHRRQPDHAVRLADHRDPPRARRSASTSTTSCPPIRAAPGDDHAPDEPHCFNGTNLHSHGLWVNPSGNGDNVLLSINPGVQFQYEYNVPRRFIPRAPLWYHTHRHGSTALQVSSGMAGALIIRGDRLPTADHHGDIDTLVAGAPERVLVMQQIQYACLDASGESQDQQGRDLLLRSRRRRRDRELRRISPRGRGASRAATLRSTAKCCRPSTRRRARSSAGG